MGWRLGLQRYIYEFRCSQLVHSTLVPSQLSDPTITLEQLAQQYSSNYRRVFIEHPRLRLDGVYISVCQYVCVHECISQIPSPLISLQEEWSWGEPLGHCMLRHFLTTRFEWCFSDIPSNYISTFPVRLLLILMPGLVCWLELYVQTVFSKRRGAFLSCKWRSRYCRRCPHSSAWPPQKGDNPALRIYFMHLIPCFSYHSGLMLRQLEAYRH